MTSSLWTSRAWCADCGRRLTVTPDAVKNRVVFACAGCGWEKRGGLPFWSRELSRGPHRFRIEDGNLTAQPGLGQSGPFRRGTGEVAPP